MALSSRDMVRMFRALSDPTRVEIVQLVSKSPRNVSELTSLVGVSQPKVSRHLKILRDAGLLSDVRRGKWVWYEMAHHSDGEQGGTIATAMSMLFHGSALTESVAVASTKVSPVRAALAPAPKLAAGATPARNSREGKRKRAGKPAGGPEDKRSERPTETPAPKQARKPVREPAQTPAPKPARKPVPKPTPKEVVPVRPGAPRAPAKDIEDFLL